MPTDFKPSDEAARSGFAAPSLLYADWRGFVHLTPHLHDVNARGQMHYAGLRASEGAANCEAARRRGGTEYLVGDLGSAGQVRVEGGRWRGARGERIEAPLGEQQLVAEWRSKRSPLPESAGRSRIQPRSRRSLAECLGPMPVPIGPTSITDEERPTLFSVRCGAIRAAPSFARVRISRPTGFLACGYAQSASSDRRASNPGRRWWAGSLGFY